MSQLGCYLLWLSVCLEQGAHKADRAILEQSVMGTFSLVRLNGGLSDHFHFVWDSPNYLETLRKEISR